MPRALAWCPWAELRHVTRATTYAMTRATTPCMVPTGRAKRHHACHSPCHDMCHDSLHGAHESSQDIWRLPPPVPWHVPRPLAWFPRVELRHMTLATARAMMRAMTPYMVPSSQVKKCNACHYPCHDTYNDPQHGARGCARTRDPCHDECHDPHVMVPRHILHAIAHATTPAMTHSIVVEFVLRHMACAMVRALFDFRSWCLDKFPNYGLLLITECY